MTELKNNFEASSAEAAGTPVAPAGPSNPFPTENLPQSPPSAPVAPLALAPPVGGLGGEAAATLTPEELTKILTLSVAQLHHLKERFEKEFEAEASSTIVPDQKEDAVMVKKQVAETKRALDASQTLRKEDELMEKEQEMAWLTWEAEVKATVDWETEARIKEQDQLVAKDEELVAMKANLYEERACPKEGEENLVASKANAANQRRHADKAVLKAGEMEEKVEMLMSEVKAMRGAVEAKREELNDSKASELAAQRKLDQELFAQVPLPPSPAPQEPEEAPAWVNNAAASASDPSIPAIPASTVSTSTTADIDPAASIITIPRRTCFLTSRSENILLALLTIFILLAINYLIIAYYSMLSKTEGIQSELTKGFVNRRAMTWWSHGAAEESMIWDHPSWTDSEPSGPNHSFVLSEGGISAMALGLSALLYLHGWNSFWRGFTFAF